MTKEGFLHTRGDYHDLIVYKKSECLYDITYYFINTYLQLGDRTRDQMLQAARSGKQNILEGSSAGFTSKETEIKLMNVAKASLEELRADYEDYLRVRDLEIWDPNSEKGIQCRNALKSHLDSAYYRAAIKIRSDATIANIAITMLHQTDKLLQNLIEKQERDFIENGGIRENMSQARKDYRNRQR